MSLTAKFQNIMYVIQITDHAQQRINERNVSISQLLTVLETGEVKVKPQKPNAYWVFADIPDRTDNFICVSLVIETKNLVVKTVLINWRPQ
jgi:hypothetical protein